MTAKTAREDKPDRGARQIQMRKHLSAASVRRLKDEFQEMDMIAESIVRSCLETAKLCAENHPQIRMSRPESAACGIAMSLRHSKNVANFGDADVYGIDKAYYLNALTSLGQHEVVQIISAKSDL